MPTAQMMLRFFLGLAGRPLAVLLVLACLAILIYSNTFSASFHFDDEASILNSSQVKDLSWFWDTSGTRYVGVLSFALNYHFGRFNVFGYHLVNLTIHIINGFLVYSLISLLFRALLLISGRDHVWVGSSPQSAKGIALLAAVVFVVHPIQTQAVVYIVQRYASLVTMFYLLTIVCYLQSRLTDPGSQTKYIWYFVALGSTILAMKTKEISFTLPVMLLLVEAMFFRSKTWKTWLALIPFWLTLPIILFSLNKRMGQAGLGFTRETLDIDRPTYLFTQFRVIVTYLRLLAMPLHQNLDYDYPMYHSLLNPPVLLSFLFLVCVASAGVYLLLTSARFRLVGFGMVWFFVTLSIESSIIPIRDVIVEHRVYLASIGVLLAGVILFVDVLQNRPMIGGIAIGLIVVALSVATYRRNPVWENDLTLWTDVVAKSPNKPRGHNNLATTYSKLGRLDDAIREFSVALRLNPMLSETHNDLGVAYAENGQLDDAIREYTVAAQLKPDAPSTHYNLGNVYLRQSRVDDAIREYRTALQRGPESSDIRNNLGNVYLGQGKLDEAMTEYLIALRLDPGNPEIHTNLGIVYAKQSQVDMAINEYRLALRLDPNLPDTHYNLGVAYAREGRLDEAISEYLVAIQLDPLLLKAHYNLGNAYKLRGLTDEARKHFEMVLKIRPDFAPAKQALGSL